MIQLLCAIINGFSIRDIRQRFLESMGIGLEDCIIVMDEAHNLPDMANEINFIELRLTIYEWHRVI